MNQELLNQVRTTKNVILLHKYVSSLPVERCMGALCRKNPNFKDDLLQVAWITGYTLCNTFLIQESRQLSHDDLTRLVCRACINAGIDFLRRARRTVVIHHSKWSNDTGNCLPVLDCDRTYQPEDFDFQEWCHERNFSDREIKVAWLRYQGYRPSEIAKMLDIPSPRVSESLRSMREKIELHRRITV